jgi:hypothetical protein
MSTPNTSNTAVGYWTELGSCTLTSSSQECLTTINIVGGYDGSGTDNTQATVSARVKQQAAMGGAPLINVTVNGTAENINASNIEAVTTQNDGSKTIVQLWGQVTNTFEQWEYTPTLNANAGGAIQWVWTPSTAFQVSLPTGVGSQPQTAAVYGDGVANSLLVESLLGNTSSAFQVQDSSGNGVLDVDTANDKVEVASAFDTIGSNNLEIADGNATGVDIGNTGLNNLTTIWGSGLVKSAVGLNSTNAFQVQNASSDILFTVDTSGSVITISGTTSTFANLTLTNAHFKSTQTTAPTVATPTHCGTSPSSSITSGSTDSAGRLNMSISGTGSRSADSDGGFCTTVVTFNQAYGAAPKSVLLTSRTNNGVGDLPYVSNITNTTFTVEWQAPNIGDGALDVYYWVIE